jgi:hypothetical protein
MVSVLSARMVPIQIAFMREVYGISICIGLVEAVAAATRCPHPPLQPSAFRTARRHGRRNSRDGYYATGVDGKCVSLCQTCADQNRKW